MPASARAELRLGAPFLRFVECPDGLLADGDTSRPDPLPLAAGTAIGLVGAGAFVLTSAIGLSSLGESSGEGSLLSLAAVPPLAALLCFPPLYLLTALRGRAPGLLRLAGIAASGPAMAGTALGAGTPLLLLYLLTGEIDGAFGLLVVLLGLMGLLAGAWGAIRTARRAGAEAPGSFTVLAHYAFTLWTAAVLAIQLS